VTRARLSLNHLQRGCLSECRRFCRERSTSALGRRHCWRRTLPRRSRASLATAGNVGSGAGCFDGYTAVRNSAAPAELAETLKPWPGEWRVSGPDYACTHGRVPLVVCGARGSAWSGSNTRIFGSAETRFPQPESNFFRSRQPCAVESDDDQLPAVHSASAAAEAADTDQRSFLQWHCSKMQVKSSII